MTRLYIQIAVAAALFLAIFGGGWKIGYERAEAKVGRQAKTLVIEARAARDQCRLEVGKYSAAVADATLQQNEEMKLDRERTNAARRSLEAAVKQLSAMQAENLAVANLAREYLKDATDACSGAPMDPEFNGLLERLANPTRYGDGPMPAGSDRD